MTCRIWAMAALAAVVLAGTPVAARAALAPLEGDAALSPGPREGDYVEAHAYRAAGLHVPGRHWTRQNVTAWAVTAGSWNGEILDGLSLVLVRNRPESGPGAGDPAAETTNCYISHRATPAQRDALLSAFLASQEMQGSDVSSWRVEPAVIRIEAGGRTVIVHLGLIA